MLVGQIAEGNRLIAMRAQTTQVDAQAGPIAAGHHWTPSWRAPQSGHSYTVMSRREMPGGMVTVYGVVFSVFLARQAAGRQAGVQYCWRPVGVKGGSRIAWENAATRANSASAVAIITGTWTLPRRAEG